MRHTRSAKLLSIFLLATAGVGTVARPAAAQVQAARAGRDLTLAVGEQLLVPAEGISQFSVANEGIVDVRVPSDVSVRMLPCPSSPRRTAGIETTRKLSPRTFAMP